MKRLCLLVCLIPLAHAEHVTILRDEYGVPHIFAQDAAGVAFGSGYAQAEDRLEEMLKNYRRAEGTMAEVFGPEFFRDDWRQRLWRHRLVAEQHYQELSARSREIIEAFQAGVRQYMHEHPEQVPAWAPKLEPWQVVALGRYIIWGWPEGEAGGKLLRAGIQPDPIAYHGSNEMLLAPARTAMHAPIAVVDPHLSWYGPFRFYEIRLYGGDLVFSGACILGLPFPVLGHSRYASIAMTTGGPDTSDVYEEEVQDGKYKFRGEWRPLEIRHEKIGVKAGDRIDWKDVTIESTLHGPIAAHKNGKAYSVAIPYANEVRLMDESWGMVTAHNLAEMKKALAMLQLMAQNIMVGTVDGDIYYVRNGRVPVRPAGCDPSKPMPGATGACEWQGLHPFEDLVQITNPPQGYMQNCNVSPFAMMKNSPLVPEEYAAHPYLYNERRTPPHQRAAMVLDLLDAAHDVTAEQAIGIAFSPQVWHVELWQARIRKAAPDSEFVKMLAGWDRRNDADSRPALAFYLFKMSLAAGPRRAVDPPPDLTDDQIREALAKAAARLQSGFPPDATFGTLFRVGRQGVTRTWPVGGGSLNEAGMATPRAISFEKRGQEMVGHGGQTSTQIVILTKPPKSYMVIPLGESDHPDSPHFDDQAEKLFSKSRVKPTFFLDRRELEKHVTRREKLEFAGASK
ncbi:MAG TPA: penicillin acylase family protein [Bryobacteraceae bacterium]|nr:penicillin acylase family protein [Bryobacteraceae bacterium]